MIHNRCNFFSRALGSHVDVELLLPCPADNDLLHMDARDAYPRGQKFKALYLLHGALEDETSWLRQTAIERYAQRHGVAVIMPRGQNGFYVNARFGLNYYDFITEELPRLVEFAFPISADPSDRLIAGCSMGGYGAVRCALGKPGFYAAFADLSGAVNPVELEPKMAALGFDFFRYDLLFGGVDQLPGTQNDLFRLIRDWPEDAARPQACVYCGREDEVNTGMNRELFEALKGRGFPARFFDGPGGHDWVYWDWAIGHFLDCVLSREN